MYHTRHARGHVTGAFDPVYHRKLETCLRAGNDQFVVMTGSKDISVPHA